MQAWRRFTGRLPGEMRISTVSAQQQRQRFATALKEARLPPDFQWYSLRRGGATHAFCNGMPLERILIRGRWAHTPTARIYVNDGLAMLRDARYSLAERRRLKAMARQVRPVLPR